MGISFVGASAAANGVSPVSLTLPASQAGDVGLLFLTRGSNAAQPVPSGWTQIGAAQQQSNGLDTLAAWRVLTPSDSGATIALHLDVGDGNGGAGVVCCAVYRGVDQTTPVDGEAAATDPTGATATSHTTPAVTVATTGAWVVDSVAVRPSTGTDLTTAAGRTRRVASPVQASNYAIIADTNAGETAGSVAGVAYSTGATNEQSVLYAVALKPAAAPAAGNSHYQMQNGVLAPVSNYVMTSGVLG